VSSEQEVGGSSNDGSNSKEESKTGQKKRELIGNHKNEIVAES
jgi:hypothetical protein